MRRLPIYFVIDVSESMVGDTIEQVQNGIAAIVKELRTDPYALETVYISIIAFAGKAKKLTPMVELTQFYPPKLPIGGGTSLGNAMTFLMNDIDSSIQKTTMEQKGDWKPIIFLFTDGNPTDTYDAAFQRWNQKYRRAANLIVVSLGNNATMSIFGGITENVLLLRNTDAAAFKAFFKWVTASIKTSSVGVSENNSDELKLADSRDNNLVKIDLEKHHDAKIDDNFAVILAKCQTNEHLYLMKYQKNLVESDYIPQAKDKQYKLVGAFPIDSAAYAELSEGTQAVGKVNTSLLLGVPTCPCCGNQAAGTCGCGGTHCINVEQKTQTCPWCGNKGEYGYGGEGYDISRTRG